MREFTGVVADIRLERQTGLDAVWQIALEPAEFGVGDRGTLEAVTRMGTKLEIAVAGVVEEGEVRWLLVEKPLAAGTEVVGRVLAR